jgi:hypothetical protein
MFPDFLGQFIGAPSEQFFIGPGQFQPPVFPRPGGPTPPPPPSEGPQVGTPTSRPPSFVPARPRRRPRPGVGTLEVEPRAIRPCAYRFVYLWLRNGQQFWAWLVFVGRRSVSGWRWNGFNWVYFGTDLRNIDSFICY